ncbi:zf-TFIIB domain-containing protein [Roseomonas chloroacetimidivorans]|uniref:TFIIB-type zinc ribbon-containing protein n=1 Tax=Roseomonas chloroacetimidivorans TaxID=1766656 RepID=UPI003C792102
MSDPITDRPAVGMPCPRCRIDLVMSDRQGIEIDFCPQCRGVWLDRGELDKIIERSAQFQQPQAQPIPQGQPPVAAQPSPWLTGAPPPTGWAPEYGGHGGHDQGHRGHGGAHGDRRGHNSFLGRLFD